MAEPRSLTPLYATGALASILCFVWTLTAIGLPWPSKDTKPSPPKENAAQAPFEPTGNLSTDVQRALILLNELEGEPGSSRAPHIKQAITDAENRRGLSPDGSPDQALLRQLATEIETRGLPADDDVGNGRQRNAQSSTWSIEKWKVAVQILSALSGIALSWLTFFRVRGENVRT